MKLILICMGALIAAGGVSAQEETSTSAEIPVELEKRQVGPTGKPVYRKGPVEPGVGANPLRTAEGRSAASERGTSATAGSDLTSQLHGAITKTAQGDTNGVQELRRTIVVMAPEAKLEQVDLFVEHLQKILPRADASKQVLERFASGLALALKGMDQPLERQQRMQRLHAMFDESGLTAADARILVRDLQMLAASERIGADSGPSAAELPGAAEAVGRPGAAQSESGTQGTGETGKTVPGGKSP